MQVSLLRDSLKQTLMDHEMYRTRKEECHVDGYSHVIRDYIMCHNNVWCMPGSINMNH